MKKIPNYRWMVCKGMQTVALTTTQREAEAEAARVGGEVHELMPQKNPPDPEYSALLGGGVWSKGYATPDPIEEFYRHEDKNTRKMVSVSRSRSAVEALTAKQDKGWGGTTEAVDGMKPLLFMTRKVLLANKDRAAAKFIPALRPYRLDYTNPAHPEMIFKMPVYKIWADAKESQKNDAAKQFWNVLEFSQTGNGKMDKFALLLRRAMPKFDAKVRKEAEALERALLTMHQIAVDLPLKVYKGDFHYKNAAVDAKGNLILLDPLVAEMKWVDAEALWKKLRWPVGKQPKKPKAPKAPRVPKAAKAAKKATTKTPANTDDFIFDELTEVAAKFRKKYPVGVIVTPKPLALVAQWPDAAHIRLIRTVKNWRVQVFDHLGIAERDVYFTDFRHALAEVEVEAAQRQRLYAPASVKKPTAKPAKKATTKKFVPHLTGDWPAVSGGWTKQVAAQVRKNFREFVIERVLKTFTASNRVRVFFCDPENPKLNRDVRMFQMEADGRFGVVVGVLPAGVAGLIDVGGHDSDFPAADRVIAEHYFNADEVGFAKALGEFFGICDSMAVNVFKQVLHPPTKSSAKPAKKATTKKPTAKKAGAFTAAGLPRLEAKPATKKPRAAKAAKAPKKLQGKKLDAFVSAVYSRVFNRVAVMWDKIGPIYKAIRAAYEMAADDEQGQFFAMEEAKKLRAQYGEK